MKEKIPHVVIIGAGFGGLHATQRLAGKPVRVTLIDKRNYHLFQPLLYQVATAGISPHEIAYPVRAIFQRQENFSFLMSRVQGVDLEHKLVLTEEGQVPYDYLILAAGASVNFFGNASLEQNALPLKDVSDAVTVRNHVLRMFERASLEPDLEKRQAFLTFVTVGGGPTGVESAGALSELIRLVLRKDYHDINVESVRVILLEAAGNILTGFPKELQDSAQRALERKEVEVRLNAKVANYDGQNLTFDTGEIIPTCTVLWSAGVQAASLMGKLGLERAHAGRIKILPTLQVPGQPDVYVIGDAAYLEEDGKPLPMVAPVATQQGKHAAMNILAQIGGKPLLPFRYNNLGMMATIGRNAAVAVTLGMQFRGFLAWGVWLVIHLVGLIGFRNRLIVLINWAWDYFFYDRAVRLISRE
ncbi:MAG: FAD-dependent oxidoreductase [Chloroflexi bacterium HGW-Chloroflexi-6]|nr:MAG: FAD-dependent oxidoreductase [Chloroflexi bacterium HGW-Chloroflexi-6]